ncbi:MAG TPA: SDR family oxidoreductase [Rhizobiaceae bacterium]|nr:SDR family oxidoreductase [Rhizobiaceae bacterium]
MDFGLSGRSALVMGASKGLGFAVAKELAAEGVDIAICARDELRLKSAAEKLGATALVGDLRQPGAGRRLVEQAAAALGKIDILVVNTGGPATKPFENIAPDDWRNAFEGLFMSATDAIGAAMPAMRERKWGRILLVTSIAAKEPITNFTISNALRAGLHGLTKTLSREFAANGITVNALMPGYTMTERLAEAKLDLEKVNQMIPMGRIGRPEEFAALAAFLASERAGYITGQAIACDGGALWSI